MGRLQDFVNLPDVSGITKEIYINERLGTFTVKPMTATQHTSYQNRCKGKTTKDGTSFDGGKFNLLISAGQIIEPNFSDAEFLSQLGCATASDFMSRKFLAGEIADIAEKIILISGFGTDINEDIEEAKN